MLDSCCSAMTFARSQSRLIHSEWSAAPSCWRSNSRIARCHDGRRDESRFGGRGRKVDLTDTADIPTKPSTFRPAC
jgi:hypothetical protein